MFSILGAGLLAYAGVGNGNVVANLPVTIVQTGGGSGSGTATIKNVSAGGYNVAVTADVACLPGVGFSIAGGTPFGLAGMAQQSVSYSCAAGQAPGLDRCLLHATDTNTGDPLVDLLAVCENAPSSTLVPSMSLLDFTTVVVGETGTIALGITNPSSTTITKLFLQTDDLDGDFEMSIPCNPDASYCDGAIPPVNQNESTTVFVKCTPRSVGPHTATLEIATDTGQRFDQPVTLSCTGSAAVVPVLGVSPDTVTVAAPVEVVGASAQTAVHLTNLGAGTLQVTDIRSVDVDAGAAVDWTFSLTGTCTGTPCSLAANQQVAVNLTFDPSSIGTRRASLLISFHDTIDRTRSVPLAATGLGATLDLIGGSTLDFGSVPLGHSSQLAIALANRGNRDTTATLSTTPPFTLNPAMSVTVSPGVVKTVTATCTPVIAGSASTTIGAQSADADGSLPIAIAATCTGITTPLFSNPTALALGEIRINAGAVVIPLQIESTGAPLTLSGTPALDLANPSVSIGSASSPTTTSTINVTLDPQAEGDIKSNLVVADTGGDSLKIPIVGRIVTASYAVPQSLDVGTFCVNQPTASSNVTLVSNGTATIALAEPTVSAASPFQLSFTSPSTFPANLPASKSATIAVTPERQAAPTTITDTLTWTTDVEGDLTSTTAITAAFINSGGAIAPPILDFGKEPVHLFVDDGQRVMIQNCNGTVLELDPPTIKAPFSIDSPNFPATLDPNETATFSVGFHPTRIGTNDAPLTFTDTLTISSPQLMGAPLQVQLVGTSITDGTSGVDAGAGSATPRDTSFYACSCSSNAPGGGFPIVFALAFVIRRRRCGSS